METKTAVQEIASLIEPMDEKKKDTVKRLSKALDGQVVNSKIFWDAVNEIRSRFKK